MTNDELYKEYLKTIKLFDESIDLLGLRSQILAKLKLCGIHCIRDLVQSHEFQILAIKNIGDGSVANIRHSLSKKNLFFGMKNDPRMKHWLKSKENKNG